MARSLGNRLYDLAGVEVEHHEEEIAGVRTHWVEAGPPDGPPALFVHGAGGAAALWYSALPVLVAAGYRAVAVDCPGHGESEIPAWPAAEVMPRMLAWTEAFAVRLERPLWIGHSFGGYLGLLAWRRRPMRFRAMVLAAAAGFAPGRSRWMEAVSLPVVGELLLARRPARGSLERMARRMAPLADDIPHGEDALDYVHEVSARPGYGRFRLALIRGTNHATRSAEWRTASHVADVTCPVLLAWGPHDFLPIADARRAVAVMPRARLVELPGTGHLCYLEAAGSFNAALSEFVANLDLVAAEGPA